MHRLEKWALNHLSELGTFMALAYAILKVRSWFYPNKHPDLGKDDLASEEKTLNDAAEAVIDEVNKLVSPTVDKDWNK